MATDSHSRDCRGFERGHNRRVREDAKENGMRKKLTNEEYQKEVAQIWEQFKKLELMIKAIQRVGWLVKNKVKWQRLQMKREQMNSQQKERLLKMIKYLEKDLKTETSSETKRSNDFTSDDFCMFAEKLRKLEQRMDVQLGCT